MIRRNARWMIVLVLLLVGCGSATPDDSSGTVAPPAPTTAVVPTDQSASIATPDAGATEAASAPTSAGAAEAPADGPWTLALVPVVDQLDEPVHVTHAGDGSARLFVVEKVGRIRVVRDGALVAELFLDITDRVGSSSSEQGLLSVAFHPDFAQNGLLFVDYTDQGGDTVVARFRAEAGTQRVDPATATTLLTIKQPAANHNGGQLAFGPDGFLYIGMGDGGGAGDPRGNGQNLGTLLGKMLRIDVDSGDPYGIPTDNPFVGTDGALPEIWSFGLRNPWRFSFDRTTGDMFIGDVGQNLIEEIDHEPAGTGGRNYGWNHMEGNACYEPSSGCTTKGMVAPVVQYEHDQGCSVTGGFRYRGTATPQFGNAYIFGDYCSGTIWMLTPSDDRWEMTHLLDTDMRISSFGEDEAGELYLVDTRQGQLVRLSAW